MFLACALHERGSCYIETHVGSVITSVINFNLQRKQGAKKKKKGREEKMSDMREADAAISL